MPFFVCVGHENAILWYVGLSKMQLFGIRESRKCIFRRYGDLDFFGHFWYGGSIFCHFGMKGGGTLKYYTYVVWRCL